MFGLLFNLKPIMGMDASSQLQIIAFWAPWCLPCLQLSPIIHDITQRYMGRVLVIKINVEEQQITSEQYNIEELPTVIFLKEGRVVHRFSGTQSQGSVERLIHQFL